MTEIEQKYESNLKGGADFTVHTIHRKKKISLKMILVRYQYKEKGGESERRASIKKPFCKWFSTLKY